MASVTLEKVSKFYGNVEAVMAVYKYNDGKIMSLETGATPMPK